MMRLKASARPEHGLLPLAIALAALSGTGCISWFSGALGRPETVFAPLPVTQANPMLVGNQNPDYVFEQVVDVIDDYFKIEREVPVRREGDLLLEAQIDTFPLGGSTILEPWNRDAVNLYEQLEGTLQSVRRRAQIRVIPAPQGFLVDVVVHKELEDVARPEAGIASRAPNLNNDTSLRRYINPVGGGQPSLGWIALGRDTALEQEIIAHLQARLAGMPRPPL